MGANATAPSSCYACLRGYSNQRDHDRLRRGYARDILAALLQPDRPAPESAGGSVLEGLDSDARSEVSLIVDLGARQLAIELLRAGAPLPIAGWQADDAAGSVLEVAWPDAKVAILDQDGASELLQRWLSDEGWDARLAESWSPAELLAAVAGVSD